MIDLNKAKENYEEREEKIETESIKKAQEILENMRIRLAEIKKGNDDIIDFINKNK